MIHSSTQRRDGSKLAGFNSRRSLDEYLNANGGFYEDRFMSDQHWLKYLLVHEFHELSSIHDDVIKWKNFPRYWPFVRGIHRSPVNSPHKGQWRGALMFSVICARINGWVNNREAGDLRRYRVYYLRHRNEAQRSIFSACHHHVFRRHSPLSGSTACCLLTIRIYFIWKD